jgi:hypothetical protein
MPTRFKNRASGTDARIMSDTVVNDTPSITPDPAFSLDGDAPRLGHFAAQAPAPDARPTPMLDVQGRLEPAPDLPAPTAGPGAPIPAPVTEAPILPTSSPNVAPQPAHAAPPAPVTEAPILPTSSPNVAPAPADSAEIQAEADEPRHPMAHLMPEKSKPSEASIRAAEIRAAQKAKSRKIKIGIAVGSIALAALVGPPVFKWTADAINEAGNTSTEDVAD